jgi:hypothetical protein
MAGSELAEDGDTLWPDLGFGCPELGYFPAEIAAALPFGLRIERDATLPASIRSLWAQTARIWARSRRPKSRCISSGFDLTMPPARRLLV